MIFTIDQENGRIQYFDSFLDLIEFLGSIPFGAFIVHIDNRAKESTHPETREVPAGLPDATGFP